jgi:predicted polyphosphate/ATP-dependent NAD kinase
MSADLESQLLAIISRKLSVSEPVLVEMVEADEAVVKATLSKLETEDLVQQTADPTTDHPLYSPTSQGITRFRQTAIKAL